MENEVTSVGTYNPKLSGVFENENRNGQWFRVQYNVDPATGVRTSVYSATRIKNPLAVAALNTQAATGTSFLTRPLISIGGFGITPVKLGLAYGAFKVYQKFAK